MNVRTSPPLPASLADRGSIAKSARQLYDRGPLMLRLMQQYRSYICPVEAVLRSVSTGSGVLDVGCGEGLLLGLLADSGRIAQGHGVDASRAAIQTARSMGRRSAERSQRLRYDVLEVRQPLPEGPLDVVMLIDVMHHVPRTDRLKLLDAMLARLVPRARIIYKDMVRRPRWRAQANRLHDLVLARQWIHYEPIQNIDAWARQQGLRTVEARRLDRLWYGHELRVFDQGPAAQSNEAHR